MRSFRSDPYLWVHLAGLAAVPLLLELCLLGLAVSSPFLPAGFEFLLVGTIGVAPVLWMQWQRPFSIFSLVVLALKPEQLTADQRRILRSFKAPIERILAVSTAIALLAVLWQLYQIAPIASEVTPFTRFGRLGGILVAAIAFLGSNLFLQVPVSVLRVLLTPVSQLAAMEPYPVAGVAQDFTLLGIRVQQILPNIIAEPDVQPVAEAAAAIPEVTPAEVSPVPVEAGETATEAAAPATAELADDFEDELTDDFEDEPEAVQPLDKAADDFEDDLEDDFEDELADDFEDEPEAIQPVDEAATLLLEPTDNLAASSTLNSAEIDPSTEINTGEPQPAIAEPPAAELAAELAAEPSEDLAEVIIDLPEDALAVGLEISETDTVLIEIASETGEMTEVVITKVEVTETIAIEITALEDEEANAEPENLAPATDEEAIALENAAEPASESRSGSDDFDPDDSSLKNSSPKNSSLEDELT
ncbi:MAG TPA: low-complexity tail membrane protein [Coleofasciculaceae cyanobacterium]